MTIYRLKKGKVFFIGIFSLWACFYPSEKVFSYESLQTLKLKNEVASLESRIMEKKKEYNDAAAIYIEYNLSADAFEKGAAEAERKANVQKTMVAVKVGYDTAMTLSSPPRTIKDFILGKIVDAANSASWDIKFEYKLQRPDTLPPSADTAYQKALLRANEKVSWAKSDKAASQGKEIEEGTNEYNYFMFKGFAEGLSEQAQALRKKQSEQKALVLKLKSEIEKLESDISARRQILGEQQKSDNLHTQFKDSIEKEKAAEEARQQQISKETNMQLKDGISDAAAIDLSPELSEIKSVSDKLISGKISLEAYQSAKDSIKTRAYNKTNPALKRPPHISESEEINWRKEQKKILDAKREDFDKKAEEIYQSVCDASLNAHEELIKMSDELNGVIYDKSAAKDRRYSYYEKLRDGAPKVDFPPDYTREALSTGNDLSLKNYVEKLKNMLAEIPKTRQSILACKKYMDDADQQYNEYQKNITRQYNAVATKINEYAKKNFHLLRHYNKKYAGVPSADYMPEADIPHYVSGGNDYSALLSSLDEAETTIPRIISAANEAGTDLEEIRARAESLNRRLSKMKSDFQEKVQKVYSNKTTITELEQRLKQLEDDSAKYRDSLEKMKENYIALQILVNYRRDKYTAYPVIVKEFGYYKFGDTLKEIDKLIDDTDEKKSSGVWGYTAGSVLARFKKNLTSYKEEEKVIQSDLSNYLARAQAMKNSMKSVPPDQLATSPATSVYFTRSKPPRLDYERMEKDLSTTLTKKGKDFNYFSDNDRDFYCGKEVADLRQKIYDEKSEIYKIAYDAGAAYEPPRIDVVNIDGQDFYSNTMRGLITLYKANRANDTIEIKGTVDRPQNLKEVELSVDGGLTYKKGIVKVDGSGFYGTLDLQPGRTIEIKLRAVGRIGDATAEFPTFGKGIEIFYSTEDATRDLKDTINNIAESYESESIFSFMKNISDNFVGQYSTLENAVRNDFARFDAIRMKFFIDKVNIYPSMTEGFAEVRWERSWLDTATNKISRTSGNNYMRFEKSGGRWKLLSYSGTPLFGLSATSAIDSPTGVVVVSGDSNTQASDDTTTTTALPVHYNSTLRNHYDGGWVFSFVYSRELSLWEENGAPHDIEYKTGAPPVVGAPLSGKIYDFGAVSLDSVTTAPPVFASGEESAMTGHTYVVVCSDGKYAKFRITSMTSTDITFDWAYQPDGSTNLR